MLTYIAKYKSGELTKSEEVEDLGWVKLELALDEMKEDCVGKKIINKILDKSFEESLVAFKSVDNIVEL